ncbi:uncharacterized protein [Amphiura filiformis]|uniref:uncharacterized protein n=1 Tax=Amphiura filiformis TaxID=82378 RepID=UPI003B21992D
MRKTETRKLLITDSSESFIRTMGNRVTKTKTKTRYVKGWNVKRKETEVKDKTQSNIVGTPSDMKQVTTTMGNRVTKTITKAKTQNLKGSFQNYEVREIQDEEQSDIGSPSDMNQIEYVDIVQPEGGGIQVKEQSDIVGNPSDMKQVQAVDIVECRGREIKAAEQTTIGKPPDISQIESAAIQSINVGTNQGDIIEKQFNVQGANYNVYGDQINNISYYGHERTDTKLDPPAITPKGGESYLQVINKRLATLYRERYCHLATMVGETQDTDEMFMKPELALKTSCDSQKTVSLNCDDLLSLQNQKNIKNHVVLVGSPGIGKSTIVHNELAYNWGKGITNSQIDLLFVIDMCKVEQRSDVFEVIEDQLLRGVQREKLAKLMDIQLPFSWMALMSYLRNGSGREQGKVYLLS